MAVYRQITAACALITLLSACASTATVGASSSPPPTGTLRGELLIAGGPAPGSPRLSGGWVSILRGTALVAKMQVNGRFTQVLPAGAYTLAAADGSAACVPTGFAISPGRDTSADVICSVR